MTCQYKTARFCNQSWVWVCRCDCLVKMYTAFAWVAWIIKSRLYRINLFLVALSKTGLDWPSWSFEFYCKVWAVCPSWPTVAVFEKSPIACWTGLTGSQMCPGWQDSYQNKSGSGHLLVRSFVFLDLNVTSWWSCVHHDGRLQTGSE
jgi:hypothetical protein